MKRVIYAKYLLRRAQSLHAEANELASAEAVLVTHDAVEMLMRVVMEQTNAKMTERFLECWDHVRGAAGKEPPRKAAMDRLNYARVGFKHKGVLPNPATVGDHITNAVLFCAEASHEYLNLDFDSVSLTDLIQNDNARKHLNKAETAKAQNDLETALSELGLAWDALFDAERAKHNDGLFGRLPRRPFSRLGASSEVQTVMTWLDSVGTTIDVMILGIEPAKYRRFNSITPVRHRMGSDNVTFTWRRDPQKTPDEDYVYCYTFIVDFGLRQLVE